MVSPVRLLSDLQVSRLQTQYYPRGIKLWALALGVGCLVMTKPAFAHHLMGGQVPKTAFEGFMSGLAHPILGLDHFAFIVAVGLLAAIARQGMVIPITFVMAAMAGSGLHLMNVNLPGVELLVAGSVLLFGLLLAMDPKWPTGVVAGLTAIAGLGHGYAYGEAIFGAEMSPLVSYLAGFTLIQLLIALAIFWGSQTLLQRAETPATPSLGFRSAGWMIGGIGLTFVVTQVMSALFPGL